MNAWDQQLLDDLKRERDPIHYDEYLWFHTLRDDEKKPVQSCKFFGGMKRMEKVG